MRQHVEQSTRPSQRPNARLSSKRYDLRLVNFQDPMDPIGAINQPAPTTDQERIDELTNQIGGVSVRNSNGAENEDAVIDAIKLPYRVDGGPAENVHVARGKISLLVAMKDDKDSKVATDRASLILKVDGEDDRRRDFSLSGVTFDSLALPAGHHELRTYLKVNESSTLIHEANVLILPTFGRDPIVIAGLAGDDVQVTVLFDTAIPVLVSNATEDQQKFKLGTDSARGIASQGNNQFKVTFPRPDKAGELEFQVDKVNDILGGEVTFRSKVQIPEEIAPQRPGILPSTGPPVEFPEFVQPRKKPEGFNPSDKVDTRVVRLYFFRDAHRVTQIINRNAQSFHRAGVDTAYASAAKQRLAARNATIERRNQEQVAIESARQTRLKESELQAAQQQLDAKSREFELVAAELRSAQTAERRELLNDRLRDLQQSVAHTQSNVNALQGQVEGARDAEVIEQQRMLRLEQAEQLALEDQFRQEVAAAKTDPDTYAPANITSHDPVAQVSASVIGEGLIHLRGPTKGINMIRRAIAQIDAPVGQARIGIHTFQVNGERGEEMDNVSQRIQDHLDHARFLTMQTTEMMRKSIVRVATRVAEESDDGMVTQESRDFAYLYNFFGRDFIEELYRMDSEFLRTGNKLLSLHSMHTTSLASALAIMSLAKGDIRDSILQEFQMMLESELPLVERRFLDENLVGCSQHCHKHRLFQRQCDACNRVVVPLSENAAFESLRTFLENQCGAPGTLTPIQREFIRLAQIFKAQLVTELEWRQRVMERGLIEERIGDVEEELAKSRTDELRARQRAREANDKRISAIQDVFINLERLLVEIDATANEGRRLRRNLETLDQLGAIILSGRNRGTFSLHGEVYTFHRDKQDRVTCTRRRGVVANEELRSELRSTIVQLVHAFEKIKRYSFEEYRSDYIEAKELVEYFRQLGDIQLDWAVLQNAAALRIYVLELFNAIERNSYELRRAGESLILDLEDPAADIRPTFRQWARLRQQITKAQGTDFPEESRQLVNKVERAFTTLLTETATVRTAAYQLEESRRPLDHKKFLDMLIDELEDKYIELLDGTRAHIANIDNYIKRVATAIEDDLNRQFYHPAFQCVRRASRHSRVQLGQIETTNILVNNRNFGKVSPTATMEFDLPRRDILITEGMKSAKAAIDEYGALVSDPSFLALTAMASGQSPVNSFGDRAARQQVTFGGLSSESQHLLLGQSSGRRSQFGSAFENLIPDPAVYKFETGTGFEIRPVIQPDGQAIVFDFHYLYTTNVREPVRADEKHLGRVKQHFIDTDVQLSNYELRPVSKYQVALKAARTARGVPLLEDVPVAGALFRPLPQAESSLQQNLIYAQAAIYPTLFDLMGLRWAPAITDLDPMRLSNEEHIVRGRHRHLQNRVYDFSSSSVDDFLRTPEHRRRTDLYRTQESIPLEHPNGYRGHGLDYQESRLEEGAAHGATVPHDYYPASSPEGMRRRRDTRPRRYREQIADVVDADQYEVLPQQDTWIESYPDPPVDAYGEPAYDATFESRPYRPSPR